RENVGQVRDAAQAGGAEPSFIRHRFTQTIGNVVIRSIEPIEGDPVPPLLTRIANRILEGGDLIASLAVVESDQLVFAIEARAQVVDRERIEAAVVNVILSSPHHLDRTLDRIRENNGVVYVFLVTMTAPPETPAQQHVVIFDLFGRDPERGSG